MHKMEEYANKKINPKFYGKISIENDDIYMTDVNKSEQDVIFVPYIIEESDGVSDEEYTAFMEEYRINHAACPKCGSTSYVTTLVGYAFYRDDKDKYKDLNRCTCTNCSDIHTKHSRVKKCN